MSSSAQFAQVPREVIRDHTLTASDVLVYAYIDYRAGAKGWCYFTVRKAAEELRCSTGTISRATKRLEDAGYVRVKSYGDKRKAGMQGNRGRANEYTVPYRMTKMVQKVSYHAQVPDYVIFEWDLSPIDKRVFCYVDRESVRGGGLCDLTMGRIAKDMGYSSRSHVAEAIQRLTNLGYLTVTTHGVGGKANQYAVSKRQRSLNAVAA